MLSLFVNFDRGIDTGMVKETVPNKGKELYGDHITWIFLFISSCELANRGSVRTEVAVLLQRPNLELRTSL